MVAIPSAAGRAMKRSGQAWQRLANCFSAPLLTQIHIKWVTDDAVATRRWLVNLPHLLAGYRSAHELSREESSALPAAMMAYHLLLAHWFLNIGRHQAITLEVRALDWLHQHYDAVLDASVQQR
jgi:Ser/Thr protein kinase RdoA (MazF antagonist)